MAFCRFTRLILLDTSGHSDGPIFRCTTKDGGERRVRGLRPPSIPWGNVLGHSDVLCACRLATGFSTRLSRLRRSAYPLASACCNAQIAVVPTRFRRGWRTPRALLPAMLTHPRQGAVQLNPVEAVRSTPPGGPKSRKMHSGELVGRKYVSPPSPVLGGFQRSPRPLVALSPLSGNPERGSPKGPAVRYSRKSK